MWEIEEHTVELAGFGVINDTHLPLDCDGVFREEDCAYCIEYYECKERKGKKINERGDTVDRVSDYDDQNRSHND